MSDLIEAPQTVRPDIPLVKALESDDRGAAFLEHMFSVLAPGDWWWHVDGGFIWIPHRLRHEISIERLVDDETRTVRTFCRSIFTVVEGIDNFAAALVAANALNQRGLGGCAVVDFNSGELRVVTMVELDPQAWFGAYIFENIVARLVGVLETAAERLADICESIPMISTHPSHGTREDPDQLIAETVLLTTQPEAGAGMWWSQQEISAFHRGVRFFVNTIDENAASRINVDVEQEGRSADLFDLTVEIPSRVGDVMLRVQHADHYEVGIGLEFLLSTRIAFDFDGDRATTPEYESLTTLDAVNLMNLVECVRLAKTSASLLAGGWSAWQGQVALSTYLPAEVVRMVQNLAANPPLDGSAPEHVGGVMAVLSFWHANRTIELAELLDFEGLEVEWETLDHYLWSGVSENGYKWSILSDSASLIDQIATGRPVNELFAPVLLEHDAWFLPHQFVPFRMGIFNPMGPSVGTIEVLIDYSTNRALLVERLRHPLFPSLHLHAVIDREGFGRLGELVGDLITGLQWSPFDWAVIDGTFDKDVDPIIDGLRRFAENSETAVGPRAEALFDGQRNPWVRLAEGYEPRGVIPANSSPEAYWIPFILNAVNVDTHLAYLRSAWEGSCDAARGDFESAQNISTLCQSEIRRRGGVTGQM